MSGNETTNCRVAISIVTFNKSDLTRACLTSLRALTYRPFDIYVVDNNSSDNTVDMIRTEFPDVHLIVSDWNRGFAAGHRLGIEAALKTNAEYVWFLNNDAVVELNCLNELIRAASGEDSVGAVGCVSYYAHNLEKCEFWGGGKRNLWTGFGSHVTEDVEPDSLDWICGACLLMKRHVLLYSGAFPSCYFMYYEDADLCATLKRLGYRLLVANRARIYHRSGGSSTPNDPFIEWSWSRSRAIFFRKFAPFWPMPVAMRFGIDLLRHFYHGRWRCLVAVLRGTLDGLRWRHRDPAQPVDKGLVLRRRRQALGMGLASADEGG